MATKDTASELYRFASLRAINTHSADALTSRFIVINDDPATAQMKQKYPTSFLFNLATLNSYSPARLKVLADQEIQNSKLLLTPGALQTEFPYDINSFYQWANSKDNLKVADVEKKIDELFDDTGNPPTKRAAFLNNQNFPEKKFKLYETLAVNYLVPNPPDFLDTVQDMIRLVWIIERLSQANANAPFAMKLDDKDNHVQQALRATIVLPFEKPYSVVNIPPPAPLPANPTEKEDAREQLQKIDSALKDIEEKHKTQIIEKTYAAKYNDLKKERSRSNEPSPKVAMRLSNKYVDSLKGSTQKVIEKLNIPTDDGMMVNHAKERLALEKKRLIERNFPQPKTPVVININGRFIEAPPACIEYKYDPCAQYAMLPVEYRKVPMRTPGWADLKVIKSVLLKYSKGEIAHIENILKGEVKSREFNVIKRSEETTVTDEEVTKEDQRELESTDKNEVEKELASQVKEDMKFDTGVKVSAKLGTVQLDTHLDFAYNSSKEESQKTSTKTAQETVNKALSKVIERSRTQRTVSSIITTEDRNLHKLENNVPPNDNIHGMYFWVDKYYLAKVINYGSRYMLEFIVPEPAAYYLYSKLNKPQPETAKPKPKYPELPNAAGEYKKIESFREIAEDNYADLAAKYEAEVKPPPSATLIFTECVEVKQSPDEIITSSRDDDSETKFKQALLFDKAITIDDGYEPVSGWVTVAGWDLSSVTILLGNVKRANVDFRYTLEFTLNKEYKIVPFGLWGYNTGGFVCNVEVQCNRSQRKYEEWQLTTFNAIIAGFNNQYAEYVKWQSEQEINTGISIQGNNPEMNRGIEKEELKKNCIELMTGQFFEAFNAVNSNVAPLGYPEVDVDKAFEQGKHIQFFEQAFEWEQMTYVFYPYFWGRKPNWVMIKSINDTDPIFTSFIQAGAARVLVPTRPGFEESVNYFLATQRIWNGKNPPIPGDKLWVSIVDELKAQQGQFDGGKQEGEPWIFKLPTSLVYLEKTTFELKDTDTSADYPNDLKQVADSKTSADFS